MSVSVTYVIPCRQITDQVVSRVNLLAEHLASLATPEFLIVTGEKPLSELSNKRIRVLYDERVHASIWTKIAATKNYDLNSDYVVLMPDDDLNFISLDDLGNWQGDVNCGQSRHLMVIPKALGSYTLFDGWTHFFSSEKYPNRLAQIDALIAEGPNTVFSTYRSGYFRSLAFLIEGLEAVLSRIHGGTNIIEDCINLSNLVCGVQALPRSTLLRLLNSPSLQDRGIKISRVVFKEIENLSLLDEICSLVSGHIARHISPMEPHFCDPSRVRCLLNRHVDGYAAASSRKWRGWIDVEFRPFEKPAYGLIVPTPDRKFNPVFYWGGRIPLGSQTFPIGSFLSRPVTRDLLTRLPDSYWRGIPVSL
jgi:hypothetical protein